MLYNHYLLFYSNTVYIISDSIREAEPESQFFTCRTNNVYRNPMNIQKLRNWTAKNGTRSIIANRSNERVSRNRSSKIFELIQITRAFERRKFPRNTEMWLETDENCVVVHDSPCVENGTCSGEIAPGNERPHNRSGEFSRTFENSEMYTIRLIRLRVILFIRGRVA